MSNLSWKMWVPTADCRLHRLFRYKSLERAQAFMDGAKQIGFAAQMHPVIDSKGRTYHHVHLWTITVPSPAVMFKLLSSVRKLEVK